VETATNQYHAGNLATSTISDINQATTKHTNIEYRFKTRAVLYE